MITRQAWLNQVTQDADKIRTLIRNYHPQHKPSLTDEQRDLVGEDMTAPNAELACENVRDQIRQQYQAEALPDPVQIFDGALKAGNVSVLVKVLNQTWFGVPETTACWKFTGFPEVVDLLDDVPDEEPNTGDLDAEHRHLLEGRATQVIEVTESDLNSGDAVRDLGTHGPGPHGKKTSR